MTIVYIGLHDWSGLWQRPQALASALARTGECRVLYVNPPYFSAAGYVRDWLVRKPERRAWCGMRSVDADISVVDLPPLLPKGALFPAVARVNHVVQRRVLWQMLNAAGVRRPVVMLSSPADHSLTAASHAEMVIYDLMDRHEQFYDGGIRENIRREQARMLHKAAGVIVSAEALADDIRHQAPGLPARRIPNGVESSLLNAPRAPDPRLTGLPRPIIGFVGYLGPWVDMRVILALADGFASGSIVLAGPPGAQMRALEQRPNIHLLGEQPHPALSGIIDAFDVGIIPFHMNALTEAVHPLKVYDYLARGVPVVASPLRELKPMGGMVTVARDPSGWAEAVSSALDGDSPALAEQRRAFVRGHTWDARASGVLDFLNDIRAGRA
jgi:glycosyltransferase involved in cell wall biosynthesis